MSPTPAAPTHDVPSSGAVLRASYKKGEILRAGNQAFRLVKCLGLGAMGEVYEVEDQNLGVTRVVKLLRPELVHTKPHLVERFSREGRCLAKLRHPSCVTVLLADRLSDGTPFYVMEFVAGRSLAAFLAKHAPLEPRVALPILLQLASALEAVHGSGIVHRDIKPDNVLVWREASGIRATLLDFGVMKLVSDSVHEGFCGTPKFAAPEQLMGEMPTVKLDIFALGLVAFQMLTRRDAYEDFDSPLGRIKRPAPLLTDTGTAKRVSDELTMLVADMLALEPTARPTARQVADRLMACPEAIREVASRPLREDEITNEELMSISPLHAAPIQIADLESHTMPGGPPPEVMEAARRALSPTVRGQTAAGVGLGFSDDIVFMVAQTELAPAMARDDFDIAAHAMAIAQQVALRKAATRTSSPSARPGATEHDHGRPGVSELLLGIESQWKSRASDGPPMTAPEKDVPLTHRSSGVRASSGPGGTLPMARAFGPVQGGTLPMAAAFTQDNPTPAEAAAQARSATPSSPSRSSSSSARGTRSTPSETAEALRGARAAHAAKERRAFALMLGIGLALIVLVVITAWLFVRGRR